MIITHASIQDMDGIFDLLKANHANYIAEEDKVNGFVTTNITEEQLKNLIEKEKGVTVAKEGDKVLAFAFAAPWEFWKEWPFFQYMMSILTEYNLDGQVLTMENTYQYGPVCIDKDARGMGIFEKIFEYSLADFEGRYPIMATFINKINPRSYAAHTRKADMKEVGTFQFNNNNYFMMACPTKPAKR